MAGYEDYISAMAQQSEANNVFNAKQAEINREFQREMSDTAHQREVKDLVAAGLNPILSANAGASTASGSMATADTSSAQGYANLANTGMNNITQLALAQIAANAQIQAAQTSADAVIRAAEINARVRMDTNPIGVAQTVLNSALKAFGFNGTWNEALTMPSWWTGALAQTAFGKGAALSYYSGKSLSDLLDLYKKVHPRHY